jgi:hypothetical protein
MSVKKTSELHSSGGALVQVNLTGLIIFSVALVATAALVTFGWVELRFQGNKEPAVALHNTAQNNVGRNAILEQKNPPSWGQILSRDIELEQPEEYLAYDIVTNRTETWTFEGMTPEATRSLMQSCGLATREIDRALSPPLLVPGPSNTVIIPDDELVFSMAPKTRAKLYDVLGHYGSNHLMQFPFYLVGGNAGAKFYDSQLDDTTLSSLRKLLYPQGDAECFSDLEIMLRRLPTENERLLLLKAISRQSAVMVRVCIWPDTDIDKLIGYWGRGVQAKDMRPLLESLQHTPGGASLNLLYLLPQFARQHLYLYPKPNQPDDPIMDCHWTTMNFFNEVPDNRFSDPNYTIAYLQANYYKIAKPCAYGDLIFLLNPEGGAIHSAVYLADDIIFTKNGNNFAKPWMLMHLKDLLAEYTTDVVPGIAVYRNKNW